MRVRIMQYGFSITSPAFFALRVIHLCTVLFPYPVFSPIISIHPSFIFEGFVEPSNSSCARIAFKLFSSLSFKLNVSWLSNNFIISVYKLSTYFSSFPSDSVVWRSKPITMFPWESLDSKGDPTSLSLKEISPEYSLGRLMLKLKPQYFGHLMWRTGSFEKTLMLGKIEGRRRRGQQRMR